MKLRLTLKSVCQFSRVALRFLETRSNALDSPIPALIVHINNTCQCKESHLLMRGVARAWGAGIAENGWWVAKTIEA
jgi:hypothetical protein